MIPVWATVYLLFIVIGGIIGLYYYRDRGLYFIIGEGFSTLFTAMIFFYYYDTYPKPSSVLVPIMMFCYIIYWELVENMKIFEEELKEEITSKEEKYIMITTMTILLLPLVYISIKLFLEF